MRKNLGMVVVLLALVVGIFAASGSARTTAPVSVGNSFVPFCVDGTTQVQFNVYGYYDGRTAVQMFNIVLHGDPNGAYVNGVWVQQLWPGVFADYDAANNVYVLHHVTIGYCFHR